MLNIPVKFKMYYIRKEKYHHIRYFYSVSNDKNKQIKKKRKPGLGYKLKEKEKSVKVIEENC